MRAWPLVAFLLLTPTVADMYFHSLYIDIDIAPDGTCVERIDIVGENTAGAPLDSTTFSLWGGMKDLEVFDAQGNLTHSVRDGPWNTKEVVIPFRQPLNPEGVVNISLRFSTSELVRSVGEGMDFSLTYRAEDPVLDFKLVAHLPEGFVLPVSLQRRASQARPVLYPNAIVRTDGRQLSFEWRRGGLEPGEEMTFYVGFEKAARSPATEPAPLPPDRTPLAVGLAVVFFVLGYSVGVRQLHREEDVREEEILSVMEENERVIIEALLGSDDSPLQKELQRTTDFSKAKLSRILSGLEERGIITRTPVGKTNRVILNRGALGR